MTMVHFHASRTGPDGPVDLPGEFGRASVAWMELHRLVVGLYRQVERSSAGRMPPRTAAAFRIANEVMLTRVEPGTFTIEDPAGRLGRVTYTVTACDTDSHQLG